MIVYQAILNRVAASFEVEQQKFAFKRSFGAIFAGKSSLFYYRSWKTAYARYNEAMTNAFEAGNDYIADFDLVSFYELIDHNLLAERLAKRIKNKGVIDLLLTCLRKWTSDRGGTYVGHGVPQGPEASVFCREQCGRMRGRDFDVRGNLEADSLTNFIPPSAPELPTTPRTQEFGHGVLRNVLPRSLTYQNDWRLWSHISSMAASLLPMRGPGPFHKGEHRAR
jgi:hypothetical protein